MLDIVYYPVSAVLWLWHTVFAAAFGPASGVAWVLAVICLIVTFRAALIPSFLKQARNQAAMRRLRPRVAAIQRANANDRAKQTEEIRALHAEHGVGLFVGCLPALVQGVVFLGLFHVLRSFDRTAAVGHLPFQAIPTPMAPEQNAATPNYVFGAADVRSFLDADLFGAPLSATLAGHAAGAVAAVSITLMVVAAVATHLTARVAVARQDPDMPQARLLNTLTLWVFPAGALLGGAVLPIAILVYWVANNAWTGAQQYFLQRRVAAESATAERATVERTTGERATVERRRASAPKPGAKPVRTTRRRAEG